MQLLLLPEVRPPELEFKKSLDANNEKEVVKEFGG